MKKELKQIKFRAILKGKGIVNSDGDQKDLLMNCRFDTLSLPKKSDNTVSNNIKYAKREITYDKDTGRYDYLIKISSDCIRKEIFKEQEHLDPTITSNDILFCSFVTSPVGLLRGYMNTNGSNDVEGVSAYVRSSPVYVSEAIQTSNGRSHFELCSSSGKKTDTSLFYKETIGEIEYELSGMIDLKKLQYISTDPCFDRLSLKSDMVASGMVQDMLKNHYGPDADFTVGIFSDSVKYVGKTYCETGILLGHNIQERLIRYFLTMLMSININRSGSSVWTESVEVSPVYDILEPEEWQKISANKMPEFLSDDYHMFYEECTSEDFEKRNEIIAKYEGIKKQKASKKNNSSSDGEVSAKKSKKEDK